VVTRKSRKGNGSWWLGGRSQGIGRRAPFPGGALLREDEAGDTGSREAVDGDGAELPASILGVDEVYDALVQFGDCYGAIRVMNLPRVKDRSDAPTLGIIGLRSREAFYRIGATERQERLRHVAIRRARADATTRIFKRPRRPRATCSSPRREACDAFGLKLDGVGH